MTFLKKLSIKNENKSFKYSILIGDNFIEILENKFFKVLKGNKIYVIYDEFFYKSEPHVNLIKNFNKLSKNLNGEIFFFKIRSIDKFKNFENLSILLNFAFFIYFDDYVCVLYYYHRKSHLIHSIFYFIR